MRLCQSWPCTLSVDVDVEISTCDIRNEKFLVEFEKLTK